MSKKSVIVAIIIALIAGATAFLLMQEDSADPTPSSNPSGNTTQAEEETSAETDAATGTYTDYDESKLAAAEGTKIIFFHAPWCPQCRALEADINEKGVPAGVTIFKTDYDTSQELRQKYGVTIQTTLVKVDDNGNLIEKFVAYDNPTVESVKENLL